MKPSLTRFSIEMIVSGIINLVNITYQKKWQWTQIEHCILFSLTFVPNYFGMNKRTIAIFFILFANITLLALAVIPHHHHKAEVCLVGSHCEGEGENREHEATAHNHDHDGNCSTEFCVLSQVFVVPSNEQNAAKCLDNAAGPSNFNPLQATLLRTGLIRFIPITLVKEKPPLLHSSYLHFVKSSAGLRAPPLA